MTISVAERAQLAAAVSELLHDACTEPDVRRMTSTDDGFDRELWRKLAAQGVAGLLVDSEYGGVGLGALELEAVAEETGAALLPAPFLSSAVLASALINAAGTDADKKRLLPGLVEGTSLGTVALTGARGTWAQEGVAVRAASEEGISGGAEYTLSGNAHYVIHGQVADVILVVARTNGDFGVFQVTPDAEGFERTAATVFDPTVPLSTYTFDATPARRLGAAGWDTVQHALDLALIALAGEQVGGARRIFDITVDYLKTRIQFGRPIGSFQALKHMAADLLVQVESATSAARHAAAEQAAGSEKARGAIALAGFACAEAYQTTAMSAIQMHGGIGFTWEHPAHLFLRRARTGARLFGGSDLHRERYLSSKGA
ncbi:MULTISPECIES: acyl-CoA dehydrogenase family protein [unclassified Mycolicibacterium]|uniref:acyl-CoA dehydrogenase family protein n=1 Tax=unclassified Mycolicibacterium TaxID=2636767 RepID=UPI0012DBF1F6|nr:MULTISPECIES: acyl-CoA dehydrogenase family protein [unclassified Mycolicibacterium]MUL80989.1 acyl-CoA dehydrogenase [Mycolicibacterium sp. CBMA 329]MUL86755.1 acyl-CoA dehydrogenase [Mycolicibacterium sp. CBMA 331]MUL98960.1 acyl-CoA dehydrogenase [Mycolicibacterium sp. CBMA 334]MUM37052.1 acyl-CoA dehydrogenase [Mycolicibacterium sp. CBMA 247]MUM42820.1 acyl-CoA dehydrogenase [Mycolicibacterium sp. CBMA 294]